MPTKLTKMKPSRKLMISQYTAKWISGLWKRHVCAYCWINTVLLRYSHTPVYVGDIGVSDVSIIKSLIIAKVFDQLIDNKNLDSTLIGRWTPWYLYSVFGTVFIRNFYLIMTQIPLVKISNDLFKDFIYNFSVLLW